MRDRIAPPAGREAFRKIRRSRWLRPRARRLATREPRHPPAYGSPARNPYWPPRTIH